MFVFFKLSRTFHIFLYDTPKAKYFYEIFLTLLRFVSSLDLLTAELCVKDTVV